MFAAAALTVGFAMADGVVSSDIVGYAQSGLRYGATMVTPQFMPISGETIALDDIVPTGDNLDTDGGVYIQTLSAGGLTVDSYQWIDWDGEPTGWCNGDYEVVKGVTFSIGQGLWVGGTSSSEALQTAGKVGTSDISVQLRYGATATGNPYPVAINLQDIVPTGDNVDTDGGVYIQTLSAGGLTVDSYQWIDWDGEPTGWCNGDYEIVENVTFPAGQGLWVGGTKNTEYLTFPAPEL